MPRLDNRELHRLLEEHELLAKVTHEPTMQGEEDADATSASSALPSVVPPMTITYTDPIPMTIIKPTLDHIKPTIINISQGVTMERKIVSGQLNVANWLQIIAQSPSLIGKVVSLLTSIKAKDYATTIVGLTALLTNLAGLLGFTIDPQFVQIINGVAVAIVGYFTGKEKLS